MKLLIYILLMFNILSCNQDNRIIIERDDFSISYLSNSGLKESIQEGASLLLVTKKDAKNDIFIENINLVIRDVGDIKLDEFVNQITKEISNTGSIIDSKKLVINGKNCHRLIFEAIQNDIKLTFIQDYYYKNQRVYLLTFSSETKVYDDYFDEMNEVLLSFRIK